MLAGVKVLILPHCGQSGLKNQTPCPGSLENRKFVNDQENRHSCLFLPAVLSQTRMSGLLKHRDFAVLMPPNNA
jgi:hypothetical protein